MKYFFILTLLLSLTSCIYKLPPEGHIATLPNTNNPTVTREKPRTLLPGK